MTRRMISLCSETPAGFERRTPTKHDLLGGQVALLANSLSDALALLPDFSARVQGIVYTKGQSFSAAALGKGLWHVTIAEDELPELASRAAGLLDMLSAGHAAAQEIETLRIELERTLRNQSAAQSRQDEYTHQLAQRVEDLHREMKQRQLTAGALRRSEENLRTTLNSIGDAVIATDSMGRVTRMNPVAETLTGWPAGEALGQSLTAVFEIVDARTRAPLVSPVDRVFASGDVVGLDRPSLLIARDGTERRISDSGAPIRSDAGDLIGVVMVFRDITEEHALQEQLQHSRKMDAIGQLAGGVAHDFNNMLAGILGASELLDEHLIPGEESSALRAMITESAERAAGLTQKLLAFARRQPPATERVDIHCAIRDAAALLQSTLDRRIHLDLDLAADSSIVIGDTSQLQNAFLNLALNASHAMPDGGVLQFETRASMVDEALASSSQFDLQPGPHVEVTVRDTGVGIEPDVLPRIFEPFFTTRGSGSGTGLGLAAVYGTLQQHHGAICVESEPGKGSSFQIMLPLATLAVDSTLAPIPAPPRKGHGRVLVIDDEPVLRKTARSLLELGGFEVVLASDGRTGLEVFERDPSAIDVVLLDMIMPRMNGRDCFEAIRKIDPDARVVLSSGYTNEDDLEEMRANGLSGFIQKPYRGAALIEVVTSALRC